MIQQKRNKRYFYLCKRIKDSTKFEKPIKVHLNFVPTNSTGEIISLGENYSMYLKISCTPKQASMFKQGDKCYVYLKPPKEHDSLCKNADYIVSTEPMLTINEAQIQLRRLSGKI